MATQRYISTSFWDDEWIQTLDPSEKLLYLYLMTNPLTNIAGVYKITIRRICFDTGFNADTVGHILGKFNKAGKAYLHDEYMILPSWPKHQKADGRSKIKEGIEAIIKTLPEQIVKYMVSIGYRYHIKGYAYPPNYSDSDSDSDSDNDLERESASAHEEPPPPSSQPEPQEKGKYGTFENVHLTSDEYSMLLTRYGQDSADGYIERLGAEIRKKKSYPDHCAQIVKWMAQDGIKPRSVLAPGETSTYKPEPFNIADLDPVQAAALAAKFREKHGIPA